MRPNPEGRLYSHGLGLWLGTWEGVYLDYNATWVRLFDDEGRRLPTEREEKLQERAEKLRERAGREAAEAELVRLRAALEGRG